MYVNTFRTSASNSAHRPRALSIEEDDDNHPMSFRELKGLRFLMKIRDENSTFCGSCSPVVQYSGNCQKYPCGMTDGLSLIDKVEDYILIFQIGYYSSLFLNIFDSSQILEQEFQTMSKIASASSFQCVFQTINPTWSCSNVSFLTLIPLFVLILKLTSYLFYFLKLRQFSKLFLINHIYQHWSPIQSSPQCS